MTEHLERAALADRLSIRGSAHRTTSDIQRWRRENPEKYALAKRRDYAQLKARELARDLRIAKLIAPWVTIALIAKALEQQRVRRERRAATMRRWRAKQQSTGAEPSSSASLPG